MVFLIHKQKYKFYIINKTKNVRHFCLFLRHNLKYFRTQVHTYFMIFLKYKMFSISHHKV